MHFLVSFRQQLQLVLTVAVSPRILVFYFPVRAVKLDLEIQEEHKKEHFIHLSNPLYFCFLSFFPLHLSLSCY